MKNKLKLLIIGYKRSGKDTAAEFWRDNYGLTYQSSSMAAAEIFIFEKLNKKYNYSSLEECFNDRFKHRAEWFDMICDYNSKDLTRLAKEIVKKTGCYVGMRSKEEVESCKEQEIFDLVIWIDGEKRVGKEDLNSCTITKECADIIIDNNGTEEDFFKKLKIVGKILF